MGWLGHAPQLLRSHSRAHALQQEPAMRSLHTAAGEEPPLAATRGSLGTAMKTQRSQNKEKKMLTSGIHSSLVLIEVCRSSGLDNVLVDI